MSKLTLIERVEFAENDDFAFTPIEAYFDPEIFGPPEQWTSDIIERIQREVVYGYHDDECFNYLGRLLSTIVEHLQNKES